MRGVNVGMEDYDGLKPFDLAKDNKHQECMKLLFKAINTNLLVSERVCTFISPAENNYYFPLQISLTPHHDLPTVTVSITKISYHNTHG